MSATVLSMPRLLGQQVDGLTGLRLAVFQRYRALLEHLRPLEAASASALLDNDMRLFRRYYRCLLDRLIAAESWKERACRLLGIDSIDDVMQALHDEAKRDAIWKDIFAMLRDASRKAEAATAEAATATADAGGTEKHFSQNEIGERAKRDPDPGHSGPEPKRTGETTREASTQRAATGPPSTPPPPSMAPAAGSAVQDQSKPDAPGVPGAARAAGNDFPQNEIRRPTRPRMNGPGSWTEPLLPRPLIIMGKEVFPRELDPEAGDKLFE